MKSIKWLVLAATLPMIWASEMQAQTNFMMRCSTGTIKTCASFQVETVDISTGTQVYVRVRNEGARDGSGNVWGQLLTRFGLTMPEGITGVAQGSISAEGGATASGDPASNWVLNHSNTNSLGDIEFATSTTGNEGGIKGCVNPNANPSNYYLTCVGGTHNGWINFAFTTTNKWSAADAQIAWGAQSIGDGNPDNGEEGDLSIQGNTGAGEVVPEPMSVVLLGTGLAGLAGVARRRRKTLPES